LSVYNQIYIDLLFPKEDFFGVCYKLCPVTGARIAAKTQELIQVLT